MLSCLLVVLFCVCDCVIKRVSEKINVVSYVFNVRVHALALLCRVWCVMFSHCCYCMCVLDGGSRLALLIGFQYFDVRVDVIGMLLFVFYKVLLRSRFLVLQLLFCDYLPDGVQGCASSSAVLLD